MGVGGYRPRGELLAAGDDLERPAGWPGTALERAARGATVETPREGMQYTRLGLYLLLFTNENILNFRANKSR